MAGEITTISEVAKAAEAIKGIVETVPIYQDMVQPGAKQIGIALETTGKAVNLALAPISGLVWGYEQFKDKILQPLAERFVNKAADKIITPDLTIAGPSLEALRFCGPKPDLREMYINLLATAMDRDTAVKAHPAFAEIIRQLTPDEARILRFFAREKTTPHLTFATQKPGILVQFAFTGRLFTLLDTETASDYPELLPSYVDNLSRLQLITPLEWDQTFEFKGHPRFKELLEQPRVQQEEKDLVAAKVQYRLCGGVFGLTSFGNQFCSACVEVPPPAEPADSLP